MYGLYMEVWSNDNGSYSFKCSFFDEDDVSHATSGTAKTIKQCYELIENFIEIANAPKPKPTRADRPKKPKKSKSERKQLEKLLEEIVKKSFFGEMEVCAS